MRNPFLSASGWSERGAEDYVPFVGHVRDNAVLRTDGSVMGMLRLVGAPFALEDHARRNSRHRFRNAVLRNIADDTLTVVETMVRHDGVAPLPVGAYRSAFAADLENTYRREVLAGRERVNEWFVSVIVTPRAPVTRGLNALRSRMGRKKEAAATTASDELIRTLDDRMLVLSKAYAEMGPVRLGVREAGGVLFSEIAEALRLFLTAHFLPVPMVSGSLGGSIYTDRVICGRRGFEVRTPGRPSFGTLIGFKEYPDRTRPGMLNDLLSADCRVVLTNSFRFHSRAAATGSLARKQAQMANAGDRALSQMDALHDAMDDVASNQATMGSHHVSVALHCDSLPELERRTGEVRAALTNAGASVAVEDLGTEAAYWAQLPGNAAWRTRPGDISSRNFVGFSSLDGYPRGGPSPEWGAPLLRLLTSANTGFDLSLHVGGLPHMAIFGPSGSGKTVFLGMLVAALERVTGPGGTVVVFDKDNANEILVRAMGGRYLTLRAGEDSGLAPMRALPNTPDARVWLLRFVVGLIRADDGPQPDAIELRRLSKAIAFQMRMPPAARSIAGLCAWLVGEGAGSAGKRLERWGRDGDLGWAFDGEADAFDPDAGLVGVDFSALMEDETVRGPAASYLLHRVRSVIDGRRFVLAADEFWAYLPDERFAKAFEDFALTLRKGNGALVIATQQPQQVLRHPIGATLVSNMPTKVLFPNQSASRSAYCDVGDGSESLHCTPGEYRAVTEDMATGARSMLVNHGHAEWMSMKEARDRFPGPHPDFGGVVVGEAYRVDQDKVAKLAFDPEKRATWGQGGKAALLVDPCKIGPTHSLVFAGSGGFKTVSAASTLVHWTGAAVVLDPSRELGPMLAAAREGMGHKVVSLEPGTPGGINVLDWIDVTHPLAETNVHAVVGWIFGEAEGGSSDADKFFRNWGKQLVACLLAHMLWDDTMPAAAKTLRTLRAGIVTPEDQMRDVLEGIHTGSNSPMARDIAGTIKKIVPETFSGIYGNATGDTAWLSVAAYADLVSGGAEGAEPSCGTAELTEGKLTVFLQIPLKVLRDTPAVGRVLVGALLNALYEADGAVQGRVLFMLDEVRRLGPMKILEVARDAGRKYGITLQLLYQAEDQLVEQWGRQGRNAWFDSVSWRMYAAVQNTDTAKSVSDAAGGHSVMAESEGSNAGSQGKPLEAGSRSKGTSMNRHEMARALIRPDELMQDVRGDEAFVFARGSKPLRCGRAIYFRRPELRAAIEPSRFHKQAAE